MEAGSDYKAWSPGLLPDSPVLGSLSLEAVPDMAGKSIAIAGQHISISAPPGTVRAYAYRKEGLGENEQKGDPCFGKR